MRGVLAGLVVVLWAALAGAVGAEAASQPPPEPISPVNGQLVEVSRQSGVQLTIRATGAGPVRVEAWRSGGNALDLPAESTSDATVRVATIPAEDFSPGAADSLYTNVTGTVYWRPRSECAGEGSSQPTTCYGATQSFVYFLPGSAGLPSSDATACEEAKAALHAARSKWRAAVRRYRTNRKPEQRRKLHREVTRRAAAVRRERHRAARECAARPARRPGAAAPRGR